MFKIIFTIFLSFIFIFQHAFAQPLPAEFYTSTFEAKIGDEIVLQLKINPQADQPVYTVSADLFYDPEMLEYVDSDYTVDSGVFGLSGSPYFLEDVQNGMLRLTAGFPEGASSPRNFTTYRFKAKAAGVTKIYIQNGEALNAENTNIGLQQKEIAIEISDNILTAEALPPEIININLNLDILGPIAIYKEESYTFPIDTTGTVGTDDATVKIFVYNEDTELFYTEEKVINPNNTEPIYFTIPANTLVEGNYVISVETGDIFGQNRIVAQKEIGVLSNGQTWVTKNKEIIYPAFIFIVLISLIHHLAKERDLYFKIAELSRERRRTKTLKNIKKISKKTLKEIGEN